MEDIKTCPSCDGDLVVSRHNDTEVDVCVQCHGLWLDRGELGQLMRTSANMDVRPPAYDPDHVLAAQFRHRA